MTVLLIAAQLSAGLTAEFYDVEVLTLAELKRLPDEPALKRIDDTIEYDDEKFTRTGLQNNFFVRWTGVVRVPRDGRWRFYTVSDDGSRIFIGDLLIVDNDGDHSVLELSGKAQLSVGSHELRIEFFDAAAEAILEIDIEGPGMKRQELPFKMLSH